MDTARETSFAGCCAGDRANAPEHGEFGARQRWAQRSLPSSWPMRGWRSSRCLGGWRALLTGAHPAGAPFEAITAIYLNDEEVWEGVTADLETGDILVTGQTAQVSARVVKDGTTHPVDIMLDILAEVGLSEAVNQEAFDLAKSLTPEYAVGVCFENVPASQALREILQCSLYDLWVDFGEIKTRAYLGED